MVHYAQEIAIAIRGHAKGYLKWGGRDGPSSADKFGQFGGIMACADVHI